MSLIVITAILFGWLFLDTTLNTYKQESLESFDKYPIIIFSRDTALLAKLSETINDTLFIQSSTLEKRNELSDRLVNKYSLKNAKRYLDVKQLPDVLTIRFNGIAASIEGRKVILTSLGKLSDKVVVRYNEENWQQIVENYSKIDRFIRLINLILIGVVACFVFVVRLLQEKATTESIIRRRRLNPLIGKNRYNIFIETIIYTVVPVGLITLFYFNMFTKNGVNVVFDKVDILVVTAIYLVANSLVIIFTDRNYD